VDTFGTGTVSEELLERAVTEVFDLRPKAIIETLNLRRPIYQQTAKNGHFGNPDFPWEKTDRIDALLSAIERLKNA
jgi:S-adenosylmethionine synthetase